MTHHPRLHASVAPLLVVAALALGLSLPAAARADAGGPWYAGFGVGAAEYAGWGDLHFRGSGEIGWHVTGRDEGFFLGATVMSHAGRHYWNFQGGLRLGGDIEVYSSRDLAILLVPSGVVGFGGHHWDRGAGNGMWGYFFLEPSFGIAFAVADRLLHIWARPVGFDFLFFPEHPFNGRGFNVDWMYSFQVGIYFTFG